MNSQPKKAFSLIELLVVIAVIAVLMAIGLPSLRAARQSALETTCKSNLRQMGLSLNAYTADNDTLFPNPSKIYHSALSFGIDWCKPYYSCCRWHDARMGFGGPLLTEHPELQGSLYAYIGNKDLLICKVGKRANDSRGCWNTCSDCGVGTPCYCRHDGTIPVDTQYTYTMNSRLHATLTTVLTTGPGAQGLDNRTKRKWPVRQPTQVTRSPSEIFAFGEQNSWAINTDGKQPIDDVSRWPTSVNLSGRYYAGNCDQPGLRGTLRTSALSIANTYRFKAGGLEVNEYGDAFATYHRPPKGDLNAGHSYLVMLDGHVKKITVADQLRESRRIAAMDPGEYLPGGNNTLAWPIDVPPAEGWE